MIGTRRTYDDALEIKAAGLVAASAAQPLIIDLGAGEVNGIMVMDVTAVEVASSDEAYNVIMEFSNSSTFASGIITGNAKILGDAAGIATMLGEGDTDQGVGRYEVPFTNCINNVTYRYCRLYVKVAGTIATGVNFSAYLAKM